MRRTIFTEEHDLFRETARTFYLRECAPHAEQWERDGQVSRAAWAAAGKAGLIGWQFPEEYGGQGIRDFRLQRDHGGGDGGHQLGRHRARPAERRDPALPDAASPPTSRRPAGCPG